MSATDISPTWLVNVLEGKERVKHPDPSAPLLEQLVAMIEQIDDTGLRQFQDAIVSLMAALRPPVSNQESVHILLQLVAYTKPLEAKVILEKMLNSREFLYAQPDAWTLEPLVIETLAEYGGVNESLQDYLLRRAQEGAPLNTLLTMLEVFALNNDTPIEIPLVQLCNSPEAQIHRAAVLRSTFTTLRRAGMKRIFAVFCNESLERMAMGVCSGRDVVLRAIATAADAIGERDPWYHPLRAVLSTLLGEAVSPSIEHLANKISTAGELLDETVDRVNEAAELVGEGLRVTRIAPPHSRFARSFPVEYLGIVNKKEDTVKLIERAQQGRSTEPGPQVGFADEQAMRNSLETLLANHSEQADREV
jgi:hypothetical protein